MIKVKYWSPLKLNEILLDVGDLTRRTLATAQVTGSDYRQGHIYDRLVR